MTHPARKHRATNLAARRAEAIARHDVEVELARVVAEFAASLVEVRVLVMPVKYRRPGLVRRQEAQS